MRALPRAHPAVSVSPWPEVDDVLLRYRVPVTACLLPEPLYSLRFRLSEAESAWWSSVNSLLYSPRLSFSIWKGLVDEALFAFGSRPSLSQHIMSPSSLSKWFDVQLSLLRLERDSDKVEFDLLTSDKVKQGQTKLLERMGISIGGLGIKSTTIGLGGKTSVITLIRLQSQKFLRPQMCWWRLRLETISSLRKPITILVECVPYLSIIELERPAQFHTDPKIPYHTFRSGIPAGIIDHDLGSGKSSKSINKTLHADKIPIIEGVVSKVTETSISLHLSSKQDSSPPELPARCRMCVFLSDPLDIFCEWVYLIHPHLMVFGIKESN